MRVSDSPPTVDACRDTLTARVADAPGVVLCLDFDGTLAPIAGEQNRVTVEADCRSLLVTLAARDSVDVAVVSGRAIADLRTLIGLENVTYAGNHGFELYRPCSSRQDTTHPRLTHDESRRCDRMEVVPEADERRRALDEICTMVARRTASVPGCEVEHKGLTATVHHRQVLESDVRDVLEAVEAVVADAEGEFEITEGKQIWEIGPCVDWDKGNVVTLLSAERPDDWLVVYVGDDRTDEDAFEVVEPDGLGVLVGDDANTAASVRVPDQSVVSEFLELVERNQTQP